MKVTQLDIPGLLLVAPRVFRDDRGFFMESYSRRRYVEAGIHPAFIQDNHSHSRQGVVRGLHYQLAPGQSKLVRVVQGSILDVALDIRQGSPSYGQWRSIELSAANHLQLFVPVGFAHGFSVQSEYAEVEYKVDQYYDASLERGIAWDDPALAVDWQVDQPILSDKDQQNPSLAEAAIDFTWQAAPTNQ